MRANDSASVQFSDLTLALGDVCLSGDCVAKLFLQDGTQIFRAVVRQSKNNVGDYICIWYHNLLRQSMMPNRTFGRRSGTFLAPAISLL